ncbi:hypothetical protein [Thalassotalea sp. PP2-459]|uniref:hypothetical protein n=1 Tax=Thalassotalea sp. PP2-459 TaxID=1742724 RepID=UPI000943DD8C|nr:hypothetical protein [Thalassotalea sp. PP2-459]OKY25524.1 hypothetical protein BI291_15845 [Thalassotalea sp. PP2-459]
MKHILLTIILLLLIACGGGSDKNDANNNNLSPDEGSFTLHNVRFDSQDYYEGEQVTVTEGTNFEVQWVAPDSSAYRIDLHLSANDQTPSDANQIVSLRCGNTSYSLCPNATGEVECRIDDNNLTCSIENDSLGSEAFQESDLSSLQFIVSGCGVDTNCDVKTFKLKVEKPTGN